MAPEPQSGPRWVDVAAQTSKDALVTLAALEIVYVVGLVIGVLPLLAGVLLALTVGLLGASLVLSLVALVRLDRIQ